jgi:hypothetical protein
MEPSLISSSVGTALPALVAWFSQDNGQKVFTLRQDQDHTYFGVDAALPLLDWDTTGVVGPTVRPMIDVPASVDIPFISPAGFLWVCSGRVGIPFRRSCGFAAPRAGDWDAVFVLPTM